MHYSNHTKNCARSLVVTYSIFDELENGYSIDMDTIDLDDLSKLVSLIMQDNSEAALEAMSIENPEYEKSMMPALTMYLQSPQTFHSIERDVFLEVWQKGLVHYFKNSINLLLEDAVNNYNQDLAA